MIKIYTFNNPNIKKVLRLNHVKKTVIAAIKRTKNVLSLQQALNYFKISSTTYYNWINNKRKCNDSILKKCFRRHPNQLTKIEVNKIKILFDDSRFKYWSLISIYYQAIRNNIFFMHQKTFYKYANILGAKRTKVKNPKKNLIGIRAIATNLLWHCDITVVKLLDNTKAYVYIIMDNFSRRILNIKVSFSISAQTCFQNLLGKKL